MEDPMKRTKLTLNLLAVALLLVAASAAGAAEQQSSPDLESTVEAAQQAPTDLDATPAVDAPVTPSGSCDAEAQPLLDLEGQDPIPTTIYCGPCSTGGCAGAERGRLCYLGGGQGWGNCNIFSGGYMCPEGGWDCQCSGGVLP
jgi:hypothetical protein